MFSKFTQSAKIEFVTFIGAIRDAFVAMLPFVVLISICVLISQAIQILELQNTLANIRWLTELSGPLSQLFPVIVMISIALHLAQRYSLKPFGAISLAFISAAVIVMLDPNTTLLLSASSIYAIWIPILTTLLLRITMSLQKHRSYRKAHTLESVLADALQTIAPYTISFFIAVPIVFFGIPFIDFPLNFIYSIESWVSNEIFLPVYMLSTHILWLIGLHGDNVFSLVFNSEPFLEQSLFGELSQKEFYDVFVIYGGSGAGLSLILAILLGSHDRHVRHVAKLALPFSIFNINEILIFGIPLVLNIYLFIPFILVPVVNSILAYFFLSVVPITFNNNAISWTTPVFLNAWLLSDADWRAVFLQLICLSVGTLIYMPFVRRYTAIQSSTRQLRMLQESLDIGMDLSAQKGISFHSAQKSIIRSHIEVEKVINLFEKNQLTVYYQPKIHIEKNDCIEFEALLRLKTKEGTVKGPYFLGTLEAAGLAPILDRWVCRQVKQNLIAWRNEGLTVPIGLNLHPDTLHEGRVIDSIIETLEGDPIDFEIIERGDINHEDCRSNLDRLRTSGFRIALDDFGTGYAGFRALNTLPLDVVKLDKSLLDAAANARGLAIYSNAARVVRDIGLECVAEGIEHEFQVELSRQAGVTFAQGFFFSRAICPSSVPTFASTYGKIKEAVV